METDQAIRRASKIGQEHGTAAASWIESDDWENLAQGLNDGDPAVYDALPAPDLSGQYADGYSPRQLLVDCDLDPEQVQQSNEVRLISVESELCDAYELAYSQAVESYVYSQAQLSREQS